ncbi:uncharacterized protein LOC130284574 [Hyla sarda]|uniref:uncharacterized protein LOC130284574 n=1 Tax=Hyla sarda TaxID=327740 RepID=UPI0024C22E0D|nr:uncharacterized protein LOC130284574 [Hyla sarda]
MQDSWEKQIQVQKCKKFQRDQTDYENQRVYRWKYITKTTRNRSYSMSSTNSYGGESDSSASGIQRFVSQSQKRKKDQHGGSDRRRRFQNTSQAETSKSVLKVINLSDITLTNTQCEVLSLGLSFSPSCSINTFDTIKDLHLFARKLIFKKMFHPQSSSAVCSTREDLHTLQMLEELAAESNISNDKKWFPSTLTPRSYTTDALRRLEGIHMDPDMMVVTCDVESLYTSIRHTDGMEAVKRFFQMSEFEESIENQLLQMPSFMPTLPIQPN